MTTSIDRLRQTADAYEQAVRTNAASEDGRNLEQEALAAIIGASRCLKYSADTVLDLVREARDIDQWEG